MQSLFLSINIAHPRIQRTGQSVAILILIANAQTWHIDRDAGLTQKHGNFFG